MVGNVGKSIGTPLGVVWKSIEKQRKHRKPFGNQLGNIGKTSAHDLEIIENHSKIIEKPSEQTSDNHGNHKDRIRAPLENHLVSIGYALENQREFDGKWPSRFSSRQCGSRHVGSSQGFLNVFVFPKSFIAAHKVFPRRFMVFQMFLFPRFVRGYSQVLLSFSNVYNWCSHVFPNVFYVCPRIV